MRYETFIALRYLRARRKQTYVSVVTAISVLGVIVGSMALIIALALMTGFATDIRNKILSSEAHIFVYSLDNQQMKGYRELADRVRKIPGVTAVSPSINDEVMLDGPLGQEPALLKGIDWVLEQQATDIGKKMVSGSLSDLAPEGEQARIVLGKELAWKLGVFKGDAARVITVAGHMTPFGMRPRVKTFTVAGIFDTGMYDFDNVWAMVDLGVLQAMQGVGDTVNVLKVRLDSIDRLDKMTSRLTADLGPSYRVRNLVDMNRALFAALKLEKLLMFLTISLIVIVAALNIVTTLVMMVMEKGKDIAILRAMGASSRSILKVFVLQGLIIGILGTTMGCALGVTACRLLDYYQVIKLDSTVYYISYLPFIVRPLDVLFIAGIAVAISFAATLYPALKASRLNPVEGLRYE